MINFHENREHIKYKYSSHKKIHFMSKSQSDASPDFLIKRYKWLPLLSTIVLLDRFQTNAYELVLRLNKT